MCIEITRNERAVVGMGISTVNDLICVSTGEGVNGSVDDETRTAYTRRATYPLCRKLSLAIGLSPILGHNEANLCICLYRVNID